MLLVVVLYVLGAKRTIRRFRQRAEHFFNPLKIRPKHGCFFEITKSNQKKAAPALAQD